MRVGYFEIEVKLMPDVIIQSICVDIKKYPNYV